MRPARETDNVTGSNLSKEGGGIGSGQLHSKERHNHKTEGG